MSDIYKLSQASVRNQVPSLSIMQDDDLIKLGLETGLGSLADGYDATAEHMQLGRLGKKR